LPNFSRIRYRTARLGWRKQITGVKHDSLPHYTCGRAAVIKSMVTAVSTVSDPWLRIWHHRWSDKPVFSSSGR